MKLRKTDRRFHLYRFGFDCYVEFDLTQWRDYLRYRRFCEKLLGKQFLYYGNCVSQNGKYHLVNRHRHKKTNTYLKRIYFRGEKNFSLLTLGMPADDENTFYL